MQNADIGNVAAEGGASFSGADLRVQGHGTGVAQAGDSFHYVWQANQGDYAVVARIAPGAGSEGAIVIRETEESTAAGIWVGFNASGKVNVVIRLVDNGATTRSELDAGGTEPLWLKVTRAGNTFNVAYSDEGTTWDSLQEVSITLPERSLAGFAVSGANAEVTFGGFAISNSQVVEGEDPTDGGQSSVTGSQSGTTKSQPESSSENESNESAGSSGGSTESLAQGVVAGARKLFVNKQLGNDANDGLVSLKSGTAGPKKTIQAALAMAQKGDEIVVSSGSYTLNELSAGTDITITPVGEVVLVPE